MFIINHHKQIKNSDLIADPLGDIGLFYKALFIFTPLWIFSPFYSVHLIYKKYNWRRILLALGWCLITFFTMWIYYWYVLKLGVDAFLRHFNG